ncbi:MAG: DUF2911 domain-containing protein [Acidobacteriota bacterium]|nr:DUF2911 domain-containing protein [Acidobacteriota bacterium]MDH3523736.1 DUF2911 domain-containing protein [Acidobacteriota bacterium]
MRFKYPTYLMLIALLALVALPVLAGRGDDANRKSKNGKTAGTIDEVEVTVEYGRPNVKDREIWGALVPYGKVWRTGADEATAITFGADVLVEGQALAAGTYGLFTIPGESEWTFIFNNVAEQWGAFDYSDAEDALRVDVTPQASEHVEAMDFAIEGSSVVLRWEKLAVGFSVAAAE